MCILLVKKIARQLHSRSLLYKRLSFQARFHSSFSLPESIAMTFIEQTEV